MKRVESIIRLGLLALCIGFLCAYWHLPWVVAFAVYVTAILLISEIRADTNALLKQLNKEMYEVNCGTSECASGLDDLAEIAWKAAKP